MKEIIQDICDKLYSNTYLNEEHVRLSLVARLIQDLGWNIWNPQEVHTEYNVAKSEDGTRVDVALFLRRNEPTVFIEVKAVGRFDQSLSAIERQMRDYNRNNTAQITVLTDGRKWRFYLSRTGGEFSNKCFQEIDLYDFAEIPEDIELAFHGFLSKEEIASGRAFVEAERYLNSTRAQKLLREALPLARRDTEFHPEMSLAALLVRRVGEEGITITETEAIEFIKEISSQLPQLQVRNTPIIVERKRDGVQSQTNSAKQPPQRSTYGITRTRSPSPEDWLNAVDELRSKNHLRSWKDICDHFQIPVEGDSARRRLKAWVEVNRPSWPAVPSPRR